MKRTTPAIALTAILLMVCSLGLTGCGAKLTIAPAPVRGAALHGIVHGGQQPISNATLSLYAAGNTGYGSAYSYATGTSLFGNNVVQTDANGNFNFTGDYTCPSAGTEVYLVSTGGNPGPTANPNIGLMAALGPCGGLNAATYITINELTTVGSVVALSPFMSGVAAIGTSSTNAQGLTNAFAAVNKLVTTSDGGAGGPALPANATLSIAKINTLADILASCVNSAGGTANDGTACGKLFAYTTVNSTAPTDTATAMMNLAQNPNAQYTASLMNDLVVSTSPFQPTLASAPSDWSIVITYTGGGLSTPKAIALDNVGNVWTANAGNNSVSEFGNTGTPLSGPAGYTAGALNVPSAIAIDTSGNAWVANSGNATVSKLDSTGSQGAVFSGGSLNTPAGLAIDGNNDVWVANAGNSIITEINSAGVLSSFTGSGISGATAIVIVP